ncbi:2467_t:CDS:2, partial [Dentiscutata erythropus]
MVQKKNPPKVIKGISDDFNRPIEAKNSIILDNDYETTINILALPPWFLNVFEKLDLNIEGLNKDGEESNIDKKECSIKKIIDKIDNSMKIDLCFVLDCTDDPVEPVKDEPVKDDQIEPVRDEPVKDDPIERDEDEPVRDDQIGPVKDDPTKLVRSDPAKLVRGDLTKLVNKFVTAILSSITSTLESSQPNCGVYQNKPDWKHMGFRK